MSAVDAPTKHAESHDDWPEPRCGGCLVAGAGLPGCGSPLATRVWNPRLPLSASLGLLAPVVGAIIVVQVVESLCGAGWAALAGCAAWGTLNVLIAVGLRLFAAAWRRAGCQS